LAKLNYLTGDATSPNVSGPKIIAHITNNRGAWGAGFVLALSRRWPEPEQAYRRLEKYVLGDVQCVRVKDQELSRPNLIVANMCAQDGFPSRAKPCALDYKALRQCLRNLAVVAIGFKASVVAPRFGAGISGGDWSKIEKLIKQEVVYKGVNVYIYDLPVKGAR
jgi:O-acetyl-ADP-ribose deacetylase (regulator of RNase III)